MSLSKISPLGNFCVSAYLCMWLESIPPSLIGKFIVVNSLGVGSHLELHVSICLLRPYFPPGSYFLVLDNHATYYTWLFICVKDDILDKKFHSNSNSKTKHCATTTCTTFWFPNTYMGIIVKIDPYRVWT